ncbi:ceramidase domain-containing protein [Hoeflea poritis]|uniref:Ceramidase domain-containing protein n=1 Tax=Hoeflea poritis TaxID=2993659 RepID=A0ABT4VGJ7_9HYPH|nr:ceramidase domain-containing protein [Hoeflea poritis]MDA4843823.1 ceramidase domain-containing protein [Hoeflea poritis]
MHEHVDNYCERVGTAFWAEPINAVTNLAFVIAAILLLLAWQKSTARSPAVLYLSFWIAVIGIGSFLFHTFANIWSLAADVIPILIFILSYLFLAVRYYLGLPLWQSAVVALAYIPVSYFVVPLIEPLVGSSSGYVPALLAIFIVGLLMLGRDRKLAMGLIVTGGVFLVSIGFRMADEPVCRVVPLGTHFLWHIFNSVVLYRLTMIYLRKREREPSVAG